MCSRVSYICTHCIHLFHCEETGLWMHKGRVFISTLQTFLCKVHIQCYDAMWTRMVLVVMNDTEAIDTHSEVLRSGYSPPKHKGQQALGYPGRLVHGLSLGTGGPPVALGLSEVLVCIITRIRGKLTKVSWHCQLIQDPPCQQQ